MLQHYTVKTVQCVQRCVLWEVQYEVQYKRADSLDDLANEWKLAEIVESNSRIATGVSMR